MANNADLHEGTDDILERIRLRSDLSKCTSERGDTENGRSPYERRHRVQAIPEGQRARFDVSPRAVIGVALALLAVLAALLWWTTSGSEDERRTLPQQTITTYPTSEATSNVTDAGTVAIVHVAGQVRKPGVVEVPSGSRVHEAIAKAGGATENADLAGINLAREVVDGEMLYVPTPGEQPLPQAEASGNGPQGNAKGAGLINLNTANATELDELPGIGPALAERIVEDRDLNGRFGSIEDLDRVSGIGPAVIEKIRDRATT